MEVISDHRTLVNRVLGDPGNPEGELWIVRDAWDSKGDFLCAQLQVRACW